MPKNRTAEKYEKAIAAINKARDAQIDVLATQVRMDLVVPACEKHGVRFVSGNGTYFFVREAKGNTFSSDVNDGAEYIDDVAVAKRLGLSGLIRVIEVLDVGVDRNTSLGDVIEDVG